MLGHGNQFTKIDVDKYNLFLEANPHIITFHCVLSSKIHDDAYYQDRYNVCVWHLGNEISVKFFYKTTVILCSIT